MNWNPFRRKPKRRSRVRRMGNFASRFEFLIYVVMGLVILACVIISVFEL
jgi:hypothetical protein